MNSLILRPNGCLKQWKPERLYPVHQECDQNTCIFMRWNSGDHPGVKFETREDGRTIMIVDDRSSLWRLRTLWSDSSLRYST